MIMKIRDAIELSRQVVGLINEVKEQKNITNYRLAQLSGLSEAYLSYLFKGERQPTLASLFRITEALEINLADIITKVEKN